MDRDVEAVSPMYAPQGSPKNDEVRQERSTSSASIPQLLLAAMPRMLISIAYMAQFVALYSVETTRFAAKLVAVISPLISLLFSPVVGVMSDQCTHQWGRRRPFLVFATLASVVVLFLSCFTTDIGLAFDEDVGTSFFAVIFCLANSLAFTAMETPMMLLIADLAGDRQITGAAIGQGWFILGFIFYVTYFEVLPDSTAGAFVAVCILLMLVIAAVVFYNLRETPCEPSPDARSGVVTKITRDLASLTPMLMVYGIISVLIGYGISMYSSNRIMFFNTRVADDNSSGLGDYRYFIIQQICAYIFTWLLPRLTNEIGAEHVLTISLAPQALLIIMAFMENKTLVGLMDYFVIVFGGTLYVLIVPTIVHEYGTKNIGACVGALTAIRSLGEIVSIIIGDSINETDLAYQLPVLLAGIMALMSIFISVYLLHLNLKSQ